MNTDSPLRPYLRILLISILVALLGLSAAPHAVDKLLADAYHFAAEGDFLSASQYLTKVLEYNPQRADIQVQAAHYASLAGDPKLAIQNLEWMATKGNLSASEQVLLGDAYLQLDEPDKAEAIWKAISGWESSSTILQRLADLYLQKKDYISAVDYLKKLSAINPGDGQLFYQLGLLETTIEPSLAVPYLTQAAELDPGIASQAHDLADKISSASLSGQAAYTLLAAGRQLANMGEWQLAEAALEHATELDPAYADAWAFLGEARQQAAKLSDSLTDQTGLVELKQALGLDASSILANTFMGLYWERQQDYDQAQQYLEKAIAQNTRDPYLYSELGNILSKAGNLPAAQSAYETAIQLAPQDPLFYRLLAGFALEKNIQIRELALPAARQALILDPDDTDSLDVMAQVMMALQDSHSAENYLSRAIHYDPQNAPAYLHLGMTYIYLGEPDLGRFWLGAARDVDPKSWVANQATRMIEYYFP